MQVGTRNKDSRHKNGWFKTAILVVAWLVIISLIRDVWQIRTGFGRISESVERLKLEEDKNLSLRQKVALVATDNYRERLIREKLNMQKEGEVVVVLPKGATWEKKSDLTEITSKSNWEKWWNLIR